MSPLHRSALLSFLKTPHHMSEVAREFGVSPELARYHLQREVKSGQVLLSDGRFRMKALGDRFKVARTAGHLHTSGDRHLLRNTNPPSGAKVGEVKFLRKNLNLQSKDQKGPRTGLRSLSSGSVNRMTRHLSRGSKRQATFDASGKGVWWRQPRHRGGKPPAHHTLQSLYGQLHSGSLTLAEITRRFDLSKQSVKRLVKRGLLVEEWGESGIGVRYRLSETGGRQLSAMQAASRVSAHGKEVFLPFRSRSPV